MKTYIFTLICISLILQSCSIFKPSQNAITVPKAETKLHYFVVSVKRANIRQGPSTRHKIVGKLHGGEKHIILETKHPSGSGYGWFRLKLPNGSTPWISGIVGAIDGHDHKGSDIFTSSLNKLWRNAKATADWMKWEIAIKDYNRGFIQLREAYVYKKNDKILRIYHWPSKKYLNSSDIKEWLKVVSNYSDYKTSGLKPVFSQEYMIIRFVRLTKTQYEVRIEYKIRPYYEDGASFNDRASSSGYIESLFFDKMRERLNSGNKS